MSGANAPSDDTHAATTVRAPARVNLVGEHTDYNDGFVLPTTTALYTTVRATRRADRVVTVQSDDLGERERFDLDRIARPDEPRWIDYASGVAAELEAAGVALRGANLEVASEIPLGGGLSSSASFELAVAVALLDVAGAALAGETLAAVCQRAERRYAGVNCGIMDQFAVACCAPGSALLLDCRSLETRQVPVPPDAGLLLTASGVSHRLADGGYNSRAAECAAALRLLAEERPQLGSLRDVDQPLLDACRDRLPDRLYRRCRHVVSENARVHRAAAALAAGDLAAFGRQVSASHASLRDDFEVSCAEIDRLVEIADGTAGVLGSRMVGAGFGGCVLSVMPRENIAAAARQIASAWAAESGTTPWMHAVAPAWPAGKIP